MAGRIRSRIALAAVAAAVLLGPLAGASPSPADNAATTRVTSAGRPVNTWVSERAGITPGSQILWESDADLAHDLDAIAGTGVSSITIDVDWPSIQQHGPGTFWWDATDRVVQAATSRGLTVDATLAYSPTWARPANCPTGSTHCLPVNVADYATFAQAAVMRYGASSTDPALRGSIETWSIWNEPNNPAFAQPKPDPQHYTDMLRAAYPAIKDADPTATVITGGTAPEPNARDGSSYSPVTWLTDLYTDGAKGYFDAVGHHPYMFPVNPLDAQPWNAFTQTLSLHNVMAWFGDAEKKIWGTEVGAPTGDAKNALSPSNQAKWVFDYYTGWNSTFASFTGQLSYFQLRDSGTNPASWEQNMGLVTTNWAPKPAYGELQAVMEGAGAPINVLVGRRVVDSPTGGYYVLQGNGTVTAFDGATGYGSPRFASDIARGLAVMPDGKGYVVLDGYGGLHKFGSATSGTVGQAQVAYWRGWDIARDVAITPSGNGISVLDAYGGFHVAGDAPRLFAGYWRFKIARAFAYSPSGDGVYLLDGFGGIHTAGDAVLVGRSPYWGAWDIARDITLTPSGRGYTVLDGFGGVHPVGDAPPSGWNPAYGPHDRADGVAQLGTNYAVAF
ncbi:MAG TPA: hypothetical protein VIC35_04130 [Acidimicrobiia bacterium]